MAMEIGSALYVYKGEWDLPSIDFECLRALCLVKFTRFPCRIETNANPFKSGAGKLPYLQIGNKKFVGYNEIKELLNKEGYPIDGRLNLQYRPLSTAYTDWVFSNLHVYYYYYIFGEPSNYDKTHALYARRTPFPFSFYYPSSYLDEACDVVKVMAGFDLKDKLEKHETDLIVLNAKKCVNTLFNKLGKNIWMFGDTFSELDVIVYSYLSIIYKTNVPNNPLQNHIKGCKNIITFITRISRDIFKNEAFSSSRTGKSSSLNDPMVTATEKNFFETEKQTKIIAAICATVAMVSFAVWKGLHKQFSGPYRFLEGPIYSEDLDDEDEMD